MNPDSGAEANSENLKTNEDVYFKDYEAKLVDIKIITETKVIQQG